MTFTEEQCGPRLDLRLIADTMAGLQNGTFTLRCGGEDSGFTDQITPALSDCGISTPPSGRHPFATFCIGGPHQQHACSAGRCNFVDWSHRSATCSWLIMEYAGAQPPGLAGLCCDTESCTQSSTNFTCSSSASLSLCVVDGVGLECVEPHDLSICSGNFSTAASLLPHTTSSNSVLSSLPAPFVLHTQKILFLKREARLDRTEIITIVVSALIGLAAISSVAWGIYRLVQNQRNGRNTASTPRPYRDSLRLTS